MQDDIAGASCISALPVVDMSVGLNNQSANVLLGASTSLTYDVASNGSSPATGVEVDITVPANLSLDSVTASAGTCSTLGSDINCMLGDVPGLSSRTVTVMTTPVTLGPGTLDATVSTVDADERPANDTEAFLLTVDPAVDLLINTPTAADIDVDASTTIRAVLDNASILDATGVAVNVVLSNALQIDSANWSIGTCTITLQEIDCLAANFSAQSSSTLTVGVTGLSSGSKNFTVTLSSVEAEANPSDNTMDSSVRVISDKKDSGGATGPLLLLLLAGLAFVRLRRPRLAKL
jgi:hypothetical protein